MKEYLEKEIMRVKGQIIFWSSRKKYREQISATKNGQTDEVLAGLKQELAFYKKELNKIVSQNLN